MASAVSANPWPIPYTLRRRVPLHHPLGSIAFWEASRGGSEGPPVLLVLPRQGADQLHHFETWTEAFEGDITEAARLDHPALLRVRDRGRAGHIPFAELEHFSGVSLREAWPVRGAGNGLPALTAVLVMARLSAAVHHLYCKALDQRREAVVHLSDGLVCCGVDGDVHPGDDVALFGEQAGTRLGADEVAGYAGTIEREVLTAVADRIPRIDVSQ